MIAALYSHLRFPRVGDHPKAIADGRVLAPVLIRVEPINRCNHDCWYRAYRNGIPSLGGEMSENDSTPEAKMLVLAHEFVDMGLKAVTFAGGGVQVAAKSYRHSRRRWNSRPRPVQRHQPERRVPETLPHTVPGFGSRSMPGTVPNTPRVAAPKHMHSPAY